MVTQTRQTTEGVDLTAAVAAMLAAGDPNGWTADALVDALGLPLEGPALQRTLEAMVARRRLARRGVGRGALYSLPSLPSRPAPGHVREGARR